MNLEYSLILKPFSRIIEVSLPLGPVETPTADLFLDLQYQTFASFSGTGLISNQKMASSLYTISVPLSPVGIS